MIFQEPKVEFILIDVNLVTDGSGCTDEVKQSSIELCGCTDGAASGRTTCTDGYVV